MHSAYDPVAYDPVKTTTRLLESEAIPGLVIGWFFPFCF